VFAAIDPMRGDEAIEELEKQADLLDPVGLKLYPASFGSDSHDMWRMDDPEVAFPVFERAKDLGINTIAIHKAVPFGPIPRDAFHPGDVDEAAASFPDIDFSIVHGGIAFAKETAWQLARFPNVYVNLDQMGWILVVNERAFAERLATLLRVGGEDIIDRLMWGSGAVAFHPQPQLEAFRRFGFPEDVRQQGDLWWDDELPRLTDEHKRKILGGNYAEFIGVDIEEANPAIDGDEFDQQRPARGLAEPFSTTRSAGEVY
jgi:predicted TIM-barrel fold metal-dependent hydrolase